MIPLNLKQQEMLEEYLMLFPRKKINGKYVKVAGGVIKPDDVSNMWTPLVESILETGHYQEHHKQILNGEVYRMWKANRPWIRTQKAWYSNS